MAVPLDAIRAIHNAFRKDIKTMDEAAYAAARWQLSPELVVKRYNFFNEVLVWHASGEEENVFPSVEKVAPLVAEAYERDHRGLDSLYELLKKAVKFADTLEIARATDSFNFFLSFHLDKEEAHLYRIFNERISMPDQAAIVKEMSKKIPQDRFPEVVSWLYALLGPDDRENMTRIWQQAFPAQMFAGVIKLIQAAIGNDWEELTRRIPELTSK
jgi:CRISPR/Cas system CSM-associated protein Csm2 small subunit